MNVIRTVVAMQAQARAWQRQGRRIGFVPTMGFLHDGHLSLVQVAHRHADVAVVSLFVNPTQFAPHEDFSAYPRDLARDEALCRGVGVDAVFYPETREMYAPDASTWVTEETLSQPLCGRSRPTHFRGVTTVVAKLFHAVLPDVAVFGQKDAQQALVIERMVRDLSFPIEIVVAPIVREADGLAMSSRNKYLTPDERRRAVAISRGLSRAQALYAAGERRADALRAAVTEELAGSGGRIDYVELVSRGTLQPLAEVSEPGLIAVAALFGKTRLIDNCYLG